jgi:hypothetical protein
MFSRMCAVRSHEESNPLSKRSHLASPMPVLCAVVYDDTRVRVRWCVCQTFPKLFVSTESLGKVFSRTRTFA